MRRVALIGGTGSGGLLPARTKAHALKVTAWGEPSAGLLGWQDHGVEVLYLARHGPAAAIAPHRVNYRANIRMLQDLQPDAVIGINAVGGITPVARPGHLVLPDQIIDYTWGRAHTFFDGGDEPLRHVTFDPPFTESVRSALSAAAARAGVNLPGRATYGATQGPRLETAAEIDRLAADGCDIVGMTAMPEAGLAREAGLAYAIVAVVINEAAGRLAPGDTMQRQMQAHMAAGIGRLARVLGQFLAAG